MDMTNYNNLNNIINRFVTNTTPNKQIIVIKNTLRMAIIELNLTQEQLGKYENGYKCIQCIEDKEYIEEIKEYINSFFGTTT